MSCHLFGVPTVDDFCLKGVKSKLLVSDEELAVSSTNGLGRRSLILSNDTLVLEIKNESIQYTFHTSSYVYRLS